MTANLTNPDIKTSSTTLTTFLWDVFIMIKKMEKVVSLYGYIQVSSYFKTNFIMQKLVQVLVLILLIIGCKSKPERNISSKESITNNETQDFFNVDAHNIENEALFRYPIIERFKKYLTEFIPTGWVILDSVSFDYNNDSFLDYVVIIETIENVEYKKKWGNEEMEMDDKPRILFVLKGTGNAYLLDCQANELILTSGQGGMMGDPYQGIYVSGNKICTSFWGGSREKWNLSHCFVYQNGNWILKSTETSGGNAELMYLMNYDFETGNFNYEYVEEEYNEALDSTAIVKDKKYSKVIEIRQIIRMDSFRPWTLEIDSVRF